MALEKINETLIRNILNNLKGFLTPPAQRYWVDYDKDADVLYLGFSKPQRATDSELTRDGVIVRKRGKKLVGITVLDASKR